MGKSCEIWMSLMDFDGESGGSLLQWPLREAIHFDGFPHISETRDLGRRWAQFPQELASQVNVEAAVRSQEKILEEGPARRTVEVEDSGCSFAGWRRGAFSWGIMRHINVS